jgi:hypothetical protein
MSCCGQKRARESFWQDGTINVLDLAAAATRVWDSTSAIQTAIAIASPTKGIVLPPPGT